MPRRARNERLRALLTTAQWSYDNLARTVNMAGAESGLRLRYDRTAVAHWLSGSCPRAEVVTLVAEGADPQARQAGHQRRTRFRYDHGRGRPAR